MNAAARLYKDARTLSLWQTVLLVLLGAMAGVAGTWVADTNPPVVMLSATAINSPVAPGGRLRIRYELDRSRSCASKLDRILFDSARVRYNLEDLDYAAAPGAMGRDIYTIVIPIPRSFGAGDARYVVVSAYQCNLLHRLWPIITRSEVPFAVQGVVQSEPQDATR